MPCRSSRRLAPYGKTLYDAVRFYEEHLTQTTISITASELCDRLLKEFERRPKSEEASLRHFTSMKETLKKFRARFGDEAIRRLDGPTIKAWLTAEPLAVKTRNRHFGYLRNVFGMAQQWNLLDADPLEKIDRFHNPKAKAIKVAILSPEALTRFLAADPDFIPYFTLNAFTGLRGAEVGRLDWSEVKLDQALVDLPAPKSKNGKRKLIDVPENLMAWLKPHARIEGSVMPAKKLQLAREHAAREAGIIPWPQNAFRHSFCSYAVKARGLEWTVDQADHGIQILRAVYKSMVTEGDRGTVLGHCTRCLKFLHPVRLRLAASDVEGVVSVNCLGCGAKSGEIVTRSSPGWRSISGVEGRNSGRSPRKGTPRGSRLTSPAEGPAFRSRATRGRGSGKSPREVGGQGGLRHRTRALSLDAEEALLQPHRFVSGPS